MVKEGCLCNNTRLKVHLKAGEEDRRELAVPNLSRICNTGDSTISGIDERTKSGNLNRVIPVIDRVIAVIDCGR
jgi:hypothetical protein